MPECPTFLDLPVRAAKPRPNGITHVLDKGLTPDATRAFLGQVAHLVDIVKVGWGIGYVDPSLPDRVRMCAEHDSPVCLGGTLLEVAAMQDRVAELRDWALAAGDHLRRGLQRAAGPGHGAQARAGAGAGRRFRRARRDRRQGGKLPADPRGLGRRDGLGDLDATSRVGRRRGPGERAR